MATSVLHPRVDMWRFALVVAACGLGAFCAQAAGDDDLLATFGISSRELMEMEDSGWSNETGGNGTDATTVPPPDENGTEWTTLPPDEENFTDWTTTTSQMPGESSGGGGDEDTMTTTSQENMGGGADEPCNTQGDCEGDLKTCMDIGVPLFWGATCSEGNDCWCTANSPKRDWPCRAKTGCGRGDACIDTSSSLACTDDTSNSSVTGCFCMAAPDTTAAPTVTRPALPTSTTTTSAHTITTTPKLRTTVISIAQGDSTTIYVAATVARETWTGGFNMIVAPKDCEPMAVDPKVKHGITDVMSNVSSVPRGYIEVSIKCDFVRRLSDKYLAGRQMQASGGDKVVKVTYVIRVPASLLGAKGFPSLASISSALGAVTVSMVSVLINAKLAEIGSGYSPVTVSGWQIPVNSREEGEPVYAGEWDADYEQGASPAVVGGVVGAVAGCVVLMLIALVVVKTKVCQRGAKSQSNQGLLHHQGQAAPDVHVGQQDGVVTGGA